MISYNYSNYNQLRTYYYKLPKNMSIDYKVKKAPKSKGGNKDYNSSKKYNGKKDYNSDKGKKSKGRKTYTGMTRKEIQEFKKAKSKGNGESNGNGKSEDAKSREYDVFKEAEIEMSESERWQGKDRYRKGDFAEKMEKVIEEIESKGDGEYTISDKERGKSVTYYRKNAQDAYKAVKKKKGRHMYKENHRDRNNDHLVVEEYSQVEDMVREYRDRMPDTLPIGKKIKNLVMNNSWNILRNAYDNTVGYVKAKKQNKKTIEHFKNNPESSKKLVYLMHGVSQNEGSQWRLGEELEREGYLVFHLNADHSKSREKVSEKAFKQIDDFHKETKIKNPANRNDHFSGHSSGADAGIFMAGDEKIRKVGIKHVQARAPVPFGLKFDNLGQKLLSMVVDMKHDDIRTITAKKSAIKMAKRKPHVPVFVVAGDHDDLAVPKGTAYPHADKHFVIKDKNSTHFGTSGGQKDMNLVFAHLHKYFEDHGKRAVKDSRHMKHIPFQI